MINDTISLRFGRRDSRLARRAYLRIVAQFSDQVLTLSRYSQGCIGRDLGRTKDISIVPIPADRVFAEAVIDRRNARTGPDELLYVGQMASHKGADVLLRAFLASSLQSKQTLRFVGGTPPQLAHLAGILGDNSEGTVHFHGHVPDAELITYMSQAAAIIVPSLEEGFGLGVWEAFACGIPVVASNTASIPEVASWAPDRITLVPPNDIGALAQALNGLTRPANESMKVAASTFLAIAPRSVDLADGVLLAIGRVALK